jgi:NAD(P)-dependent dehydrogenase (short-subunit alcohol dehydrogenase family)
VAGVNASGGAAGSGTQPGLLQGKVGLVTGGGSGIGRATAITFARDGARVTVADRNAEAGRETVAMVEAAGGEALFVEADVSQAEDVARTVDATVEAFGALHCASNNAALGAGFSPLPEIEQRQWGRALDVTLTGVWLCMKYEIPAMLESAGGSIVNIASVSGMRGEALQAAYSAAKGGVLALTKTAAAEYAQRGIRVNAVCPGGVRTPAIEHYFQTVPGAEEASIRTHAMRRLAEPEEIADVVAFLCSDRSSFVTGHLMVADGGVLVNPHTL